MQDCPPSREDLREEETKTDLEEFEEKNKNIKKRVGFPNYPFRVQGHLP